MKKLVAIILTLAAVASACAPGDDRWCEASYYEDGESVTFYGGPEEEIREMLKDPCEGTRVGEIYRETNIFGYAHYTIDCPETHIRLVVHNDVILIVNTKFNTDIGSTKGSKPKRAYQLLKKVIKVISKKAGEYAWEP